MVSTFTAVFYRSHFERSKHVKALDVDNPKWHPSDFAQTEKSNPDFQAFVNY